jgi:uncharacterized membrane protein YvlD (DUF360 family)
MTGFLLTTLVTALSLLLVDTLFSSVYISNFPTALGVDRRCSQHITLTIIN